jgi:hypothetical protein
MKKIVFLLFKKLFAFITSFSLVALVNQYKLYGSTALSVETYNTFFTLFSIEASIIFFVQVIFISIASMLFNSTLSICFNAAR